MGKVKKIDLKRFEIHQVDNGWSVEAKPARSWWDYEEHQTKTYVFTDMIDLLEWIEANI